MTGIVGLLRRPSRVDVHVGGRVRIRRRVLGLTQEGLAEAIGVTFQQVQKYELGTNRVGASRLFAIACALETPVEYFFEGFDDGRSSTNGEVEGAQVALTAFLNVPEGLELARLFPLISKASIRRSIVQLARAAAEEASEADDD